MGEKTKGSLIGTTLAQVLAEKRDLRFVAIDGVGAQPRDPRERILSVRQEASMSSCLPCSAPTPWPSSAFLATPGCPIPAAKGRNRRRGPVRTSRTQLGSPGELAGPRGRAGGLDRGAGRLPRHVLRRGAARPVVHGASHGQQAGQIHLLPPGTVAVPGRDPQRTAQGARGRRRENPAARARRHGKACHRKPARRRTSSWSHRSAPMVVAGVGDRTDRGLGLAGQLPARNRRGRGVERTCWVSPCSSRCGSCRSGSSTGRSAHCSPRRCVSRRRSTTWHGRSACSTPSDGFSWSTNVTPSCSGSRRTKIVLGMTEPELQALSPGARSGPESDVAGEWASARRSAAASRQRHGDCGLSPADGRRRRGRHLRGRHASERVAEEKIFHMSRHDPLTELPNRGCSTRSSTCPEACRRRRKRDRALSRHRRLQERERRPGPPDRRQAAASRSPRACAAPCGRPTRSPAWAATSSP